MYATNSILTFSFPAGRWLGARFRLSFLMPVVLLALMWRLQSPLLGLLGGVILLSAILLHEIAHLFVARLTGGDAEELVLWPLGGLRPVQPGFTDRSAVGSHLAGPVANLIVAAFLISPLHQVGELMVLLNPFANFVVHDNEAIMLTSLRMAFVANWCLAVFNLIPLLPLDAGHLLRWFLSLRFEEIETRDLLLRLGLVGSLLGLLAGFVFDISGVTALSAFILVLHIHEAMLMHQQAVPAPDDSFMGYDFSEGYTSLENADAEWSGQDREELVDNRTAEGSLQSGLLERWKNRRANERQRREIQQRMSDQQRLDSILEKLHDQGRDSLSDEELLILNRVSQRLREKQK